MKLLYIANQRLPTQKAYGLQISKMCEAFADEGVSVELLVPTRQNGDPKKIFGYYGVRKNFLVTTVASPDFYWPGVLDRVAFFVKQWIASVRLVRVAMLRGVDLLYSRDEFPIFLASFFSRHSRLCFEAHRYSSRRSLYYWRFRRMGVKVIAISNGIRDKFIEFGYDPKNVLVAHDGVDLQEFAITETKSECRLKVNFPSNKFIVLYAGALYDWKGAHILAEAVQNFDEGFLVAFVGGADDVIARYTKKYGRSNVLFLGRQSHEKIPAYIRAADCVILPNSGKYDISKLYTSPLKMFEYMASGTPIVASDLPSIREVLSENEAFFFEADNSKDLARTIQYALEHSTEAQQRASQARQLVESYTWQSRAKNIVAYLTS